MKRYLGKNIGKTRPLKKMGLCCIYGAEDKLYIKLRAYDGSQFKIQCGQVT